MKHLILSIALLLTACAEMDMSHLTPEQQAMERQYQHERALAAMQMYTTLQSARRMAPQPNYMQSWQPSYRVPVAPQQPIQQQPVRCNSQMIGNQVYTNCY